MRLQKIHNQLLRRHHLFHSLTEEDLAMMMTNASLESIAKGDYLFHQGEQANKFYYVVSGCIKLFRTLPDGTEKIIELVQAGQSFAEALMFAGRNDYPVSAQSVEPTEMFAFLNTDYMGLLKTNPALSLSMLADLSQRLRMRLNDIEMLSLKNSTHRVVRYLMGHIVQMEQKAQNFQLPISKRLIASQLAIQPETLSRILNRLKQEGILEVNGKEVIIHDPENLAGYE